MYSASWSLILSLSERFYCNSDVSASTSTEHLLILIMYSQKLIYLGIYIHTHTYARSLTLVSILSSSEQLRSCSLTPEV